WFAALTVASRRRPPVDVVPVHRRDRPAAHDLLDGIGGGADEQRQLLLLRLAEGPQHVPDDALLVARMAHAAAPAQVVGPPRPAVGRRPPPPAPPPAPRPPRRGPRPPSA